MRIAEVIGTVTLSRSIDEYQGAVLKLVAPKSLAQLQDDSVFRADILAAWDTSGSGIGDLIALSEGPEASRVFKPDLKPVDAFVGAILDQVHLDQRALPE